MQQQLVLPLALLFIALGASSNAQSTVKRGDFEIRGDIDDYSKFMVLLIFIFGMERNNFYFYCVGKTDSSAMFSENVEVRGLLRAGGDGGGGRGVGRGAAAHLLRRGPHVCVQLHAAARARRRRLCLEEERHSGGGAGGPERALQAGGQQGRVPHDGAHHRGRLRQLLVRSRRRRARAGLGAARPPARQAARQHQRRRGPEAQARLQGGGQAVPRREVDGGERDGRQPDGRGGGAGRARAAGQLGAGRGGRGAGAGGGGAGRRRRVHVRAGGRRGGAHHGARQGHVRGAVALPGHLRRGVRAVRHHPGVREAAHQARAGRLGHRQPRAEEVVSAASPASRT